MQDENPLSTEFPIADNVGTNDMLPGVLRLTLESPNYSAGKITAEGHEVAFGRMLHSEIRFEGE